MALTIERAHSPRFAEGNTAIFIKVKFAERAQEVEFCCLPGDPEEHGRQLLVNAVRGDYGPIAGYDPTPEEIEQIKAGAHAAVDAVASYVVPSSELALLSLKLPEAQRAVEEDDPKPEDYPLLSVSGDDIKATAADVIQQHADVVETEKVRVAARRNITEAATVPQIRQAVAEAKFPRPK